MFRSAALAVLVLLAALPATADRGSVGLGWLSGASAAAGQMREAGMAARREQTQLFGGAQVPALPIPVDAARTDSTPPEEGVKATAGSGALFSAAIFRPTLTGAHRIASAFRDLIARAEAGAKGYDAIHHSATRLPSKPPTQMTLAEIRQWIADTPGQQHAIGRYQVIPSTLDMLIDRLGLPEEAVFTPKLQDRLADSLMADAGFAQMMGGELHPEDFMDGLAQIWAGLPNRSGKSAYHGYAGNKAAMGRRAFADQVATILGE